MFGDCFRGRRVLVTGITGVKGPWLALSLLAAGARVVGIDRRAPEADSNFLASDLDDRCEFVHGDVNDLTLLERAMEGVDGVFHLAAVSLVGEARRDPLGTYRDNTLGTASVLEAVRRSASVRFVVVVTTDKVYREKPGGVWVESDPLFASEPYPVSKACAEHIAADYHRSYLREQGKRLGLARGGNVLLGGDLQSTRRRPGAGHLHVDCYEALVAGRAPRIFTPRFARPYTHGLDILSGYLCLAARLDEPRVDGEAFNFGPHEMLGTENGDLATRICKSWGAGIAWETGPPRDEPFARQALDWSKARERLAWSPVYDLDETVADLTRWYRAWAERGTRLSKGSLREENDAIVTAHRETARARGLWWAS